MKIPNCDEIEDALVEANGPRVKEVKGPNHLRNARNPNALRSEVYPLQRFSETGRDVRQQVASGYNPLASGLKNAISLSDFSEIVAEAKTDREVEGERKIECGFRAVGNASSKLPAYIHGAADYIDASAAGTCDGLG